MTMYETSDLHKRVERYEAAFDEMRTAQQDVKNVLHDQVLYERWQQLGLELGFAVAANLSGQHQQPPAAMTQHDMNGHPQLAEAWAG